jgi:hypothetical protein
MQTYLVGSGARPEQASHIFVSRLSGSAISWAHATAHEAGLDFPTWVAKTHVETMEQGLRARFGDQQKAQKAVDSLLALGTRPYSGNMQKLVAEFESLTAVPGMWLPGKQLAITFIRAIPEKYSLSVLQDKELEHDWRKIGQKVLELESKLQCRPSSSADQVSTRASSSSQHARRGRRRGRYTQLGSGLSEAGSDTEGPSSPSGQAAAGGPDDLVTALQQALMAYQGKSQRGGHTQSRQFGSGKGKGPGPKQQNLPKGATVPQAPTDISTRPWRELKIQQEEWERRLQAGQCLHCRSPDHWVAKCPKIRPATASSKN